MPRRCRGSPDKKSGMWSLIRRQTQSQFCMVGSRTVSKRTTSEDTRSDAMGIVVLVQANLLDGLYADQRRPRHFVTWRTPSKETTQRSLEEDRNSAGGQGH